MQAREIIPPQLNSIELDTRPTNGKPRHVLTAFPDGEIIWHAAHRTPVQKDLPDN